MSRAKWIDNGHWGQSHHTRDGGASIMEYHTHWTVSVFTDVKDETEAKRITVALLRCVKAQQKALRAARKAKR